MAARGSNRERVRWTIAKLGLQPGDRVLELGFGPGLGIATAAAMVGAAGRIVGLDHSPVMLKQASRRNAALIREGRVELRLRSVDQLSDLTGPCDKVFSSNVLHFQKDRRPLLGSLRAIMRPGGLVATTYQPRHLGATAADAKSFAEKFVDELRATGFQHTETFELGLKPIPAVCVVAQAPTRPEASE